MRRQATDDGVQKNAETRRAKTLVKECCELLVAHIHRKMTHGKSDIKILRLVCVSVSLPSNTHRSIST